MSTPIIVRIRCRLRTPDGAYTGEVDLKIGEFPEQQLQFELRNPLEGSIDFRVWSKDATVFHLQGDHRLGELSEGQQMVLHLLSTPMMEVTAQIDAVHPVNALIIRGSVAVLAKQTGHGEFFAVKEATYRAGDREVGVLTDQFAMT